MKKSNRKLTLNRETLRNLNEGTLQRVGGGFLNDKEWKDTVTDTIQSGPNICAGSTLTYHTYCC